MQLFLHNSDMLIPNPHAKLCSVFSPLKMAAKIYENVTTVHHSLAHNEHKNIILMFKEHFWGQGIRL